MSPRPYKSHFVRTLLRQTQRWLERGQTTARRMQVAANWSAQILLYPIYAVFQSGRLVGQRLGKSVQERSPILPAPEDEHEILLQGATEVTAETPIRNLLQEISTLVISAEVSVLVKEPEISIRAIACSTEQHSLVLVTNHNQVLDVLTPAQQHLLHQHIIWEIASYNRQRRVWNLPQQRAARFLRGVRSRVLAPLQLFNSAESILALPSVDLPVRQSFGAVRQILAAAELPVLQASRQSTLTRKTADLAPPVYIQGVASLLSTRSLVLVTNQNDLLDILTIDQQQVISQRVAWELAHYLRYLRLREQTAGLSPLCPPGQHSPALPPVRLFQWLMTWMQFGSVARSANLFQEAALQTCLLPPTPPTPSPLAAIKRVLRQLRPKPTTNPATAIAPASNRGATLVITSPRSAVHSLHSVTLEAIAPMGVTAAHSIASEQNDFPDYIDTQVTAIGYEQSWLERVLGWLDRCFVWIEVTLGLFWKTLTGTKD